MAQNASFGNEVKGHPKFIILPYSTHFNSAGELVMYDYTRNYSNIMVYSDFERDNGGDELFFFLP